MLRRKKTGQSTAEYAIVIGLVIAAAVAMQVYVKRGIQDKIKGTVDYKPDKMFTTNQYEPYYQQSDLETTRLANEATDSNKGGAGEVVRSTRTDNTQTWGNQTTLTVNGN
jgi:hypothetical protein